MLRDELNQDPGKRLICEWCGKLLTGRKKRFCSRDHANIYFANNKTSDQVRKVVATKIGKPLSDDHKRKISEAQKGVPKSDEMKQKISEGVKRYYETHEVSEETRLKHSEAWLGDRNPNYGNPSGTSNFKGHKHTEESLAKMRSSHTGCTPWNKGVPCSDSTKAKLSEANRATRETYQYDPNSSQPEYRRSAIEHYGYVCELCGCTHGILQVHHINGNHYDDRIENLVVLCDSCHARIHPNNFRGDPTPDLDMTTRLLESRNSH